MKTLKVRTPAVAGSFYPDNPVELKKMIDTFLSSDITLGNQKVSAIMAPHAGFVYSGRTAGKIYSAVKNLKFKTAVILAISHRYSIEGAALYNGCAFETPLGKVCLNTKINETLKASSPFFEYNNEAHQQEHSIEVQLPFIQTINPDAEIVPVLLNNYDLKVLKEIGIKIAEIAKEDTLIIISSDLSHYPPSDIAKKTDESILNALAISAQYKNPSYFHLANRIMLSKRQSGLETTCCGETAIIAGMYAAQELGANDFELLDYTNSTESSGDRFTAVGYGAGAFVENKKPNNYFKLSPKKQNKLLNLARESIEHYLTHKSVMKEGVSETAVFNVPAAVFVTLHKDGKLRGCIGNLEADRTLQDEIIHMAKSAAFNDPRFPPVTKEELDNIQIEISILSPLKRIASIDEVEEKKDGVLIRKGARSGTYLPQVWEHFKTKKEFINSLLAEKAGLSVEDLKDPKTKMFTYTVESFSE